MKKTTLKSLELIGYRGQNTKIEFTNETEVYARNGIGKSTLLDAFCQLLTRTDSKNRANFDLFDNKVEHTQENSLPISIIGIFDIDGNEYELKQTAQIDWVRKRGNDYYERGSGNKYKLFIDGIERTSSDWDAWITEMFCGAENLKTIINLNHFLTIPRPEDQRKLLTNISGEITKADFKGDFSDLFKQMERYSLAELKQRVKTYSKPLKDNVGTPNTKGKLHIEIEALESTLPNLDDVAEAKERIVENRAKITALDSQLMGGSSVNQPLLDKRTKELDTIDEKKRVARNRADEFEDEQKRKPNEIRAKISAVGFTNRTIKEANDVDRRLFENEESKLLTQQALLKKYDAQISQLRIDKDKVKDSVFTADNCASCGQELPADKIEELKEKFNTNKANNLAKVLLDGKAMAKQIADTKEKIEVLNEVIAKGVTQKELLTVTDLEKELVDAQNEVKRFEDTDECKTLKQDILDLQANLTVIPQADNSAVTAQKEALLNDIEADSQTVKLEEIHAKTSKDIAKKKEELRDSANELAQWEKTASDIKNYEREHASIVSKRTNELFKRVKVVMMKQNKSGEFEDACDITYNNVPSRVFNFAERIVSAIDISNVFGEAYGLNMPLFVDNVESVNKDNFPATDRQTIKLIVSEDDKELRVVNK